jgi:hypothetical protein
MADKLRSDQSQQVRAATGLGSETRPLSQSEALIVMCIACFQPITRGELGQFFGKEVSRDTIRPSAFPQPDCRRAALEAESLSKPYLAAMITAFLRGNTD